MTELVPLSTSVHQYQPQFSSIDERQNQQYQSQNSRYQAWSPEKSSVDAQPKSNTEETLEKSCKKHFTTKLFMSIFIGLVICGIPLAVMTTLYIQKKNSTTASVTYTSTNAALVGLPTQCSTYIINSDPTRLSTFTSCSSACPYDSVGYFTTGWYRFMGAAGTQLATTPSSVSACGATYPTWYNGTLPSARGSTISSTICVHVYSVLCSPSYPMTVSVTNCDGFYVYYLQPTSTSAIRYCTKL